MDIFYTHKFLIYVKSEVCRRKGRRWGAVDGDVFSQEISITSVSVLTVRAAQLTCSLLPPTWDLLLAPPQPTDLRKRCPWRTWGPRQCDVTCDGGSSLPPRWPHTCSGLCCPGRGGTGSHSSCSTWTTPRWCRASCEWWWDWPCLAGSCRAPWQFCISLSSPHLKNSLPFLYQRTL